MNCKECDNFQDDCLILVKKDINPSTHCIERNYWKQGYRCSWNGKRSLEIEDLQKGKCRCKK